MEQSSGNTHQIRLTDRKNGTVSGVLDVLSFDEHEILLDTTQGRLILRGKELHVGRLQLAEGEVDLSGEVESIIYTSKSTNTKEDSLLKRLFR